MEYVVVWFLFSLFAALIARSKGRSGTGIFILSMIAMPLIGFLVAIALSPAREATGAGYWRRCRMDEDDDDLSYTVTISTSYDDDLYGDELREDPSTAKECWVAPGGSTSVQGYEIPGGIVYVGKNLPSGDGWNVEPALIYPDLDVEEPSGLSDCDVDYWPAYNRITPRDRGPYLAWLAGGRRDPGSISGWSCRKCM